MVRAFASIGSRTTNLCSKKSEIRWISANLGRSPESVRASNGNRKGRRDFFCRDRWTSGWVLGSASLAIPERRAGVTKLKAEAKRRMHGEDESVRSIFVGNWTTKMRASVEGRGRLNGRRGGKGPCSECGIGKLPLGSYAGPEQSGAAGLRGAVTNGARSRMC